MTRLEITLCLMCPRDLVFRPNNMDKTVSHTAIKTEVFTSQWEIIGTLKVTNIDFFTQKSSLPTCPIWRKWSDSPKGFHDQSQGKKV